MKSEECVNIPVARLEALNATLEALIPRAQVLEGQRLQLENDRSILAESASLPRLFLATANQEVIYALTRRMMVSVVVVSLEVAGLLALLMLCVFHVI